MKARIYFTKWDPGLRGRKRPLSWVHPNVVALVYSWCRFYYASIMAQVTVLIILIVTAAVCAVRLSL